MRKNFNRILNASPILLLTLLLIGFDNGVSAGESPRERLAKAEAMFQERCKTAGEKIYRTAENVEGVFLMKIRPPEINFGNQFAMTDPYGNDSGGDSYIKTFLTGYHSKSDRPVRGAPPRLGYQFVEAIDPADGNRYRYTGTKRDVTHVSSILMGGDGKTTFVTKDFVLDKTPASDAPPRYGVTYVDISTREEREYWIAGSWLKVIDLRTNEVIAERIGYMMDRGQGNTSGGRSPWLLAANDACPTFQRNPYYPIPPGQGASAQVNQTEDFVEKILKPARGVSIKQ